MKTASCEKQGCPGHQSRQPKEARLTIDVSGYRLAHLHEGGWNELAVLAGGAHVMLQDNRPVDQAALEEAIQRSEDWL